MRRCSIPCAALAALVAVTTGCGEKVDRWGQDTGWSADGEVLRDAQVPPDDGESTDGGADAVADAYVPHCGDGVVEGNELCDDTNLGSASCLTQGFSTGVLLCSPTCDGFSTTFCENAANLCGNGVREDGEACDGQDVGFFTCSTFGGSGQLACNADCTLNPGGCDLDDFCALNGYYGNGVCDLCEDLGGVPDPDCAQFCGPDGHCADNEAPQTGYLPSCLVSAGSRDPDCNPGLCGDSTAEAWENCDGADLRNTSCMDLGFASGALQCDTGCHFDVTGCARHPCGDGSADGNEICDGADLNGEDCTSILAHRFVGGTLACNQTCDGWDTSGCNAPVCGDDVIQGREQCDNASVAGVQCHQVGYLGGTVACDASCHFDWSGCTVPQCGDAIVEGYEQCDGTNLDGADCTDWGFTAGTLACDPSCVVFDFNSCTGSPTPP